MRKERRAKGRCSQKEWKRQTGNGGPLIGKASGPRRKGKRTSQTSLGVKKG